jgi:hypothetical protein
MDEMNNRVGIFLIVSSPETNRDHGASVDKDNDDDDYLDIVPSAEFYFSHASYFDCVMVDLITIFFEDPE